VIIKQKYSNIAQIGGPIKNKRKEYDELIRTASNEYLQHGRLVQRRIFKYATSLNW
jgi:hypothetical protein